MENMVDDMLQELIIFYTIFSMGKKILRSFFQ